MSVKWGSFPYRARFGDPAIDALEPMVMSSPEQLCQAERHMMSTIPASHLELLFSPADESMTVHRAWFTCSGCHSALEGIYDPETGPETDPETGE